MRRKQTKVGEREEEQQSSETVVDQEEISLSSWLNLYEGFITDTADLLKDEISNIKSRKIDRNAAILKTEKKPEVVRLSKNIVTSFNDSISKAIKDLQCYGTQMSEELQKRFNLPDDWMQSTSTSVSISGSDINGPTGFQRKEMENRLGFLLNDARQVKDSEADKQVNEIKITNGPSDLLAESEIDTSNDGYVAESVSDENLTNKVSPKVTRSKGSKSTPKKSTPTKVSDNEEQEENEEANDAEVDVIPASEDEDQVAESNERRSKSPCSPSSKTDRRNAKSKQDTHSEFHTPKKSTQNHDDSSSSKKKRETPKNSASVSSPTEQSDVDSDGSGKTCILPRKKIESPSPSKPGPASVKKERQLEISKRSESETTSEKSELTAATIKTSAKSVVKKEPEEKSETTKNALDEGANQEKQPIREDHANNDDIDEPMDDDIMHFLTPPPADSVNFGEDLDETMTVLISNPLTKSMESISEAENQTKEDCENKKAKDEVMIKEKKPVLDKEALERSRRNRKEEKEAMKDILGSSSSDDSDSSRKKKKGKTPQKRETKPDGGKKDITAKNAERSTNSMQSTDELCRNDPKLKNDAVKVRIERLSPAIEKSLADNGYVVLKGFSKMKKSTIAKLKREADASASSDSDSSTASNDSEVALRRALKKLSRNSIISTKRYDQKRVDNNSINKKKSRNNKRAANGEEDELLSLPSDSDASIDCDTKASKMKPDIRFSDKDDDIVSCDGSEDIDPDSDNSSKKKSTSRSNSSRNPDIKRKKYIPITVSSGSDSEKQNMRDILGSDSDSSDKKKRQSRSKKAKNSSDSDSDFIKAKKKVTKKKQKGSDSDISLLSIKSESESDSDSDFIKSKKSSKRRRDSSSEKEKKRKKRRRRIVHNDTDDSEKKASNDSDIEEVPVDDEHSSQKGRKNIRKIMSNKELAKTTKEAEREEEERRKRLADRQKLFNGIHKAPESDKLERLILDVDPETKEPVVEVDTSIVKNLKPHQAEGIKFMYNACFESVELIKQDKVTGGCILAHCMGLGKTLQSIAFVHTLLTNEVCKIRTALVICPLSTVNNWFNEFRRWTDDATQLKIHKLFEAKSSANSRIDYLKTWQRRGGVGLLHYDMFRRLADPKGKTKMSSKLKAAVQEALLDPGPDIVICDEGHLLKNCKSMLSLAVGNIRTHRRVVLTGTPLQNNLVEYHTMMNFVKPNLLGSLPEFTNRFVNPIKNGQHADSTERDVKTMKRRAHVLHRKLEGCVQRCDYSILAPYLPPKYEYIIKIKLSEKQELLYKHYINNIVDPDPLARRRSLLKYYAELVKVWSHPIALTMRRANKDDEDETSDDESMKDFIVNDESTSTENDVGEDGSSDDKKKSKSKRRTRAQAQDDNVDNDAPTLDEALQGRGWWNTVFKSKSEMQDTCLSGKLVILQEILKTSETIGDKVLVFSQYLSSLDIIEEFLQDWDQEAERQQKDEPLTFPLTSGPQQGRWRRNIEYFRIDGATKVNDRQRDCDKFNKKSSLTKGKLFLISTKAGGLGINLFGANRVVIFDASWNPSQDMQSIFRVYRFGQDKPCYIYRLIAQGTMEEKILRRQITKLSLSSRVVDEHQIERHFKFDDVNEMYVYDEEDPALKDAVLAVPKDRLLADLLMSHRDWIRGYEEFDSLLENKPDEGLSNEEKELAWEEYRIENERNRLNQNNSSLSSAATEAETFLKVKARLQANHPLASPEQVEQATRCALLVIEKIRLLMLMQNSGSNVDALLAPLKVWLQAAVSPREPSPEVPPTQSILPDVPPAFYQVVSQFQAPTMQYQQYAAPRPPSIRRTMPHLIQTGPSPHIIQNMSHNFRNIASNTILASRLNQPNQHHLNGYGHPRRDPLQ